MAKQTKNYVNNGKLLEEMIAYKEKAKLAKENDEPKPQVSNYVGECILLIANRLSLKPNFVNYSYREEMICDGIENCLMYLDNFNPEKSSNPFAYFTQIIYFAFIRRIQKEKKQQYIKHKTLENSLIFNTLTDNHDYDDPDSFVSALDLDNDTRNLFVKNFETNLVKKRKQAKKGLEKFVEDEDENSTDH
jgi:hypothetical protein